MNANNDSSTVTKSKKYVFLWVIALFIITFEGILVYSFWLKQNASLEISEALSVRISQLEGQISKLEGQISKLKSPIAVAREPYQEANIKLSPPSNNENRVVFLGDSITEAWKLDEYFPGKSYINRGISGQTTPQMLIRFQADVIALKPKSVVIQGGTNDIAGITGPTSLEAIEENLVSMSELAQAKGIRVILASLLPVKKEEDGTYERPIEKIKALNKWIKGYANQSNLTYLDYYSAMSDENGFLRNDLSDDGLHPNAKGFSVMSLIAQKAISSTTKLNHSALEMQRFLND